EQVRLAGDPGSTNDVLIPLDKMDKPDLTMEEYVELEAEKARRRGVTPIIRTQGKGNDH
nr:hypothetical protein [Tanacetum cinerariifolium]